MPGDISLVEIMKQVGTEIGISDWITVDQTMIDTFADATLDHQFIHVDPERAKARHPMAAPSRMASERSRCFRP